MDTIIRPLCYYFTLRIKVASISTQMCQNYMDAIQKFPSCEMSKSNFAQYGLQKRIQNIAVTTMCTWRRSKRHLRSTQDKVNSLERARQRMKSAPPGECYETEHGGQAACCPYEEHLHHMCRASLTLPAQHHRYSYHGPCGCSSTHLADPPPPYDYFRWRYLLKVQTPAGNK
jgi:hypothetical protein